MQTCSTRTAASSQCSVSCRLGSKLAASRLRNRVATRAVQQDVEAVVEEAQASARAAGKELTQQEVDDIYLGFAKGDYGPREGRKGRFIKDNPRKYPKKEDLGPFLGATGGWAGGEAALWQLREEIEADPSVKSTSTGPPTKEPAPMEPKPNAIYIGFSKDELPARKSGARGRFIEDDPAKYPAKDDIGLLRGATGGFAGGEKGLQTFVEEGEVKLRQPGQPGGWQFEPVSFAGLLVLGGGLGGLLLTDLTDLGERAVDSELEQFSQAAIDDNTKMLLLAAIAVLASAGVLAGTRALIESLNDRLRTASGQAQRIVITGLFGIITFFAARAVLEL